METDGISLCVLRDKNGLLKSGKHAQNRKRGQTAAEERKAKYRHMAELSAEELRAKRTKRSGGSEQEGHSLTA